MILKVWRGVISYSSNRLQVYELVTFREALEGLTRGAACGLLSSGQPARDYLESVTSSIPGLSLSSGLLNAGLTGIQGLVCGGSLPIFPTAAGAPFSGGQCVGAEYQITATMTLFRSNGNVRNPNFTITGGQLFEGPIESIFIEGGNAPTPTVVHNNGQQSPLFSTTSNNTVGDLRDVVIVRPDGLPDDCGDRTAPPLTGPFSAPVVYDDNNGDEVSTDFDVTIEPPIVDGGNNLIVPVLLGGVDVNLNGTLNVSTGDISFEFGAPGGGDCCPPVGDIPELPDTPDEPEEPNEEPPFVAVVVSSVAISPDVAATKVLVPGGPPLYIPRLGTISFRVKAGRGSAWMSDISIKHPSQIVPVPAPFVAVGWAVQAIPGVEFNVVAVPVDT